MLTSQNPRIISLILGLAGGVALIAAMQLSTTRAGLIVYAASILLAATYVRASRIPAFRFRFEAVLIAFLVESVVFYAFIVAQNIADRSFAGPLLGHAWRLTLIAALGATIAAVTALITRTTPRRT